jgi:cell division protein FtsL
VDAQSPYQLHPQQAPQPTHPFLHTAASDFFKEKQEIMHLKYQLNLEAGRRQELEQEVQELYRQLDQSRENQLSLEE